jgi:hypothetical protein
MIEEMISSDKSWDSIKIFIESVMKEKLGDERQLLRGVETEQLAIYSAYIQVFSKLRRSYSYFSLNPLSKVSVLTEMIVYFYCFLKF